MYMHSIHRAFKMHKSAHSLGVFGRDSDLYELMQALEVMPNSHSPPNLAASAQRFNSPFCAHHLLTF